MNGGQDADVVVVGAGLGGLAAANYLHRAGRSVRIVEAGDAVGGRVRTDPVDGFRLDRGFQVLLSSYPSARALLDYEALDLRAFEPGARVRTGGGWSTIADPWRRPGLALQTALSGVGSIGDKLRIARLRTAVRSGSPIERYDRPEVTTADYLRQSGVSDEIIAEFFRPFFAGIFLDPDLTASSRMFEFLYRMFSEGEAVIPAIGMQAIPEQLAGRLPPGSVELGTRVARVGEGIVELEGGRALRAPAIVVAAGAGLPELLSGQSPRLWRAVSCLYFAAPAAPAGCGPPPRAQRRGPRSDQIPRCRAIRRRRSPRRGGRSFR
ncbi:MAG: FAD-dependent oxidoreductase [Gemmatimonadales bacterium]